MPVPAAQIVPPAVEAAPVARPGPGRHTRIGPDSSWLLDPREIWQYRELLWTLAGRDLKVRYKQTVLGVAWVILQPLATALILTFVFGTVLKIPFPGGIPPLLFIFGALTGFNLFRDIVNRAGTSLVGNRPLVSKIYFPRVLLPLSAVLNALVDFVVGMALFVVIWIIVAATADPSSGAVVPAPGWILLLWPACVLMLVMIALGVGMAATAMAVSWRDVGHVIPVALMLALYASPVMYDVGFVLSPQIDAWKQAAYFSNPLAGLLAVYRHTLLGAGTVSWPAFAWSVAASVLLLSGGLLIFRKMERRFADVI
jgi:lipopolysaccharide transport system permease protein